MRISSIVAVVLLLPTLVSAQRLSDADIATAITEAQGKKDIKPLRVGKRAALIKSAMVYELGAVYTPRLRVAMAARTAIRSYKPFSAADVTDDMASLIVLFVVPPRAPDRGVVGAVEAETILVLPKGSKDPAQAIRPEWTKTDTASYQNGFGAKWEENTVVAAFDPKVLAKGLEFVVVFRGGDELRGEIVDEVR